MFSKKILLFYALIIFASTSTLFAVVADTKSKTSSLIDLCIKNIDVNFVDNNTKRTLLMYAVLYNNFPVAIYLLNTGKVNINQRDKFGRTAYMYAAMQFNRKMMELLLQYGANKTLTDYDRKTAQQLQVSLLDVILEEKERDLERFPKISNDNDFLSEPNIFFSK